MIGNFDTKKYQWFETKQMFIYNAPNMSEQHWVFLK
jgi:hypothetical protein